jgi:membrane-bound lytic murein transglycosylase D
MTMPARIAAALAVSLFMAACAQLPVTDGQALSGAAVAEQSDEAPIESTPRVAPLPAPPAKPAPAVAAAPAPQAPPANLWVRVRSGFRMNDMNNPLVREWEQWYSSRPDYVARMVERSSRYLHHIVEEVERRKMPTEIALLPMIESAYNPQAYSRAHASGIWQFIPSTGRLYGLQQNWWYDGRRDIIAATSAALDYLEKLHGIFGDWELALASYNWGEGAVGRAIARNQARGLPGDYENLTMPAETRNYLPKLIAVKNIIADPARFGLQLADIPNEPYFTVVTVSRHIDIKLAAKLAEMPLEEFRYLNPAHNKPVIRADGSETIVLPRDKAEIFRANLDSHDKPLVSWQAHKVKPGEQPEKIAAKHGITVSELRSVNGIPGRRPITTGQVLLVPVKDGAEPHLPDLPAPPIAKTGSTRYVPPSRRGPAQKAVQKKPVPGKKAPAAQARPASAQRIKVTVPAKPKPAVKTAAGKETKSSADCTRAC